MKLELKIRERKVAKISPGTRACLIAILACVVCSLIRFPVPQKAQIIFPIFVNTTSDNVVAGACSAGINNPGCSLRGAILKANETASTDAISIGIPPSDPFCTEGVCTINLTSALPNITESVSINGPGAAKLIVKPATGVNVRVFTISTTVTVNIAGITVSNGVAGGSGGGISNQSGGTLNVSNSTITGNRTSQGSGGAIINVGGLLNVTNCTLNSNHGQAAGAIFNSGNGTTNVINSTLSGNTSDERGGAIFQVSGNLNVTNSTLTGNSVIGNESGGGIFAQGGTVNVKNTIIALNTAPISGPDVFGNFVSAGFNLIGKTDGGAGFTAVTDLTGTIASPLDPMLDPAGLKNNGGPIPTIALRLSSPAIDKGSSNGLTGILTTDARGTAFRRTFDISAMPNAAGSNGTDIGAFEWQTRTQADFDRDGKTDIGIVRPSVAEWWISLSSNASVLATQFGATTDKIAPADFTGDGKADIAFWRPSTGFWFVLRSEDFSFFAFPYGTTGDIPAPADYDADGKADAAVFRPSSGTWFIRRSSDSGTTAEAFGLNGDQPVAADYDGDGRTDIAIYRPSNGQWWLNRSTAGVIGTTFGNSSDKPVQGDYTGDGKADVTFWRPSTGEWYVLRSEDYSYFAFPFGTTGDVPAPGDYDGDGRNDATVFRPSNGTWYSQRTTAGILFQQFGSNGDRPIPNAFVP